MACTVLPSKYVFPGPPATSQFRTGRLVSERGIWSSRFFGLPQCIKQPMAGMIDDVKWGEIEQNIVLGSPAIQNSWPGLAPQHFTSFTGIPIPGPPPNQGPLLQVQALVGALPWTFLADALLSMNLFVDDCILNSLYPGGEWQLNAPFPGPPSVVPQQDGCTYAFVVMAPMGTPTVAGRGGAQVLNACPTVIAEIDPTGLVNTMGAGFSVPSWTTCQWNNTVNPLGGAPVTTTYNMCPPSNPATGYTQCLNVQGNTGKINPLQVLDTNGPNRFTWMRGQQFQVQVHYLIASNLDDRRHLYVSSQIQTTQVL